MFKRMALVNPKEGLYNNVGFERLEAIIVKWHAPQIFGGWEHLKLQEPRTRQRETGKGLLLSWHSAFSHFKAGDEAGVDWLVMYKTSAF